MEKRRGRQTPTLGFTLPYNESKGQEAVALYNETGKTAQEWQELLLEDILAVDDEGLWIHTHFGYSVPRQNGKNEVIAMRELWGLVHGERINHTAHRTSTTRPAWERLSALLDAMGIHEIHGDNKTGFRSGKSKGQEYIILSEEFGGGRIQFRTRSSKSGLGETFDLLVIDEAQEYQDDQESALKYTIVSSQNPQTIYLGTPPTTESSGTIFPKLRRDIITATKKRSGWAEWSVEQETDENNVDAWYETNPSLGFTLSERTIEDEVGGDHIDFNIQRLGLWISYNQKSAISRLDWEKCFVDKLPKLVGKLSVGIKFNKDGRCVALSIACKTSDERIFVETVDIKEVREGNGWIIDFLLALGDNCFKVIVDGASGSSLLAEQMKEARLKAPVIPSTGDFILANSKFEQAVFGKYLCHMGQGAVVDIVTNCDKRPIGSSGGFGYKSIKVGSDIAILDSIILAQYGIENFNQTVKKQKVRY